MRAEPGDTDHAGVNAKLHDGVVQCKNFFSLAEIVVDRGRYICELFRFLILTDKAFYNPYATDIFLYDGVQLIIGFEYPIEDLEYQRCQADQRNCQYR